MKSIRLLLLIGLLWISGCSQSSKTSAIPFLALPPKVKIMLLGDSITQGNTTYVSYRRPLWQLLQDQKYAVDFVGSLKTQKDGEVPIIDFDSDHEGHWGWRVDEVLAQLDGWAQATKPDIALVHLGTNDIAEKQDLQETITELKQVITKLRSANPKVKILMAQIIPLLGSEAQCQDFNGQIQVLAHQMTTQQSPVVVVDQFSGFHAEVGKDTYDGAHPNENGAQKIAQRWLSALKSFLQVNR